MSSHSKSCSKPQLAAIAIFPRLFKFWQSNAHRQPVLTLYRQLLRDADCFDSPVRERLKIDIRKRFRGSNGSGLRSIEKTKEALIYATEQEQFLQAAIDGDKNKLAEVRRRYYKFLPSIKEPLKETPKPINVDPHRWPVKPPYLSFDAQKNPFLRPRFGRHNQSLAMTLRSRTKQAQSRQDRSTALKWSLLYANAEEQFYVRCGIEDIGWSDEVKMAQALLTVSLETAEIRKSERWTRLEALHRSLVDEYQAAIEKRKS